MYILNFLANFLNDEISKYLDEKIDQLTKAMFCPYLFGENTLKILNLTKYSMLDNLKKRLKRI